ncbi:hypothetical protein D9M71_152670 [compost metagenome]
MRAIDLGTNIVSHRVHPTGHPPGHTVTDIAKKRGERQTKHQHAAQVGAQLTGSSHCTRVWWQEGVDGQQRGAHRQREHQQRLTRTASDAIGQRHEDDHTDLEEYRHPDHEARNRQRQRCAPVAETSNQRLGQRLGTAGELDDPPDHRAQGNDDRDMAQGLAHAAFNGGDQIGRFHPGDQRHQNAHQHQGHEGLELVLEHQKQQQSDP